MSQHLLLNNIDHQHTRVLHRFAAEYGDNLCSVPVFASEFSALQHEYPILVQHKQQDDSFQAVALLGLAADENLYLKPQLANGWDGRYIPALIEKGPFRIGFQQQEGQTEPEAVVHIDLAHPKVNQQYGQQLFLPQGGNSPYLQHIADTLQRIQRGMALAGPLFKAFTQLNLLQPVNIEYSLHNGEKHRLSGYYCINSDALAALRAPELEQLHQAGFLQLAFAMQSSLRHISSLIERKNQLLHAAAQPA
ncbi:MAG: SapC family protein [Gammaproteobacteria bacterium]|nr:SapC family protein [Gammaproteobacteria bacterium]MBU1554489.1 SapC family protein [Gammaproteobacteria bacterium]MBU2070683.1 SapC family protein [Gammaproteobacteria bacterium]MBU2184223.1 SapC family protein [Gammaproteobacteria bacterium]MBU2206084.1 SapC family protein [Gammaproteobacteria bacterium]